MNFKLENFSDGIVKITDTKFETFQIIANNKPFTIEPNSEIELFVMQERELCAFEKLAQNNIIDSEKGIIELPLYLPVGMYQIQITVSCGDNQVTIPSFGYASLYVSESIFDTLPPLDTNQYNILVEKDREIDTELDSLEAEIDTKADIDHEHEQYLTEHQSLEHLALVDHTHSEFGKLQNDINTKADIKHKHDEYLTEHQSLEHLAPKNHTHTEFSTLRNDINKKADKNHEHEELEKNVSKLRYDLDSLTVGGNYEFEVLSNDEIETMWKNINSKF